VKWIRSTSDATRRDQQSLRVDRRRPRTDVKKKGGEHARGSDSPLGIRGTDAGDFLVLPSDTERSLRNRLLHWNQGAKDGESSGRKRGFTQVQRGRERENSTTNGRSIDRRGRKGLTQKKNPGYQKKPGREMLGLKICAADEKRLSTAARREE